jgi:hypothetical protein
MVKFIIYFVLLVLSIVSYFLMNRYDTSKRRLLFVGTWAIFLIASVVYPLFLPKWWKLGFFLSSLVNVLLLFGDAQDEENIENLPGS